MGEANRPETPEAERELAASCNLRLEPTSASGFLDRKGAALAASVS